MEAFTIMTFTFATTGFVFGIIGFVFGIIGFTLATQANAKLTTVEKRLNELEAVTKA